MLRSVPRISPSGLLTLVITAESSTGTKLLGLRRRHRESGGYEVSVAPAADAEVEDRRDRANRRFDASTCLVARQLVEFTKNGRLGSVGPQGDLDLAIGRRSTGGTISLPVRSGLNLRPNGVCVGEGDGVRWRACR